jgi:glycosyltransferase involved in cell wall biosynthesis
MKTVDVVIPTYKRPMHLLRAVECVLAQYYPCSAIVVDDNNNGDAFREETEQVMAQFANHPKVKYLKHEVNRNGAAARNTGIKASKADFIAFLDDDDVWGPQKIKHQIEILLSKDTSYGGVSCFHVRRYKNLTFKAVSFTENENGNYF